MSTGVFQRIQGGLTSKRQNVTEFLESAPEPKKELCCKNEDQLHDHLQAIEVALDKVEDGTLGICTVCQRHIDPGLLELDYTRQVCLDHFSGPERRRLEEELRLSQIVQQGLLPQDPPTIPGVELAAFSRPAAIVGGDYFDFFHFRDGEHGLVIADVPGHGVSAGMLMSSLQTAIRTMAPETDSPAEILERLNRFYIHNIHFTTFVTIFLARFDSSAHKLTYANAGHNPPAVVHKRLSRLNWLKPTSSAIGLVEDFHARAESLVFEHGDILFLYTDGLTEAINPALEHFGTQRLGELLRKNADLGASEIVQLFRQGLEDFADGQESEDDTTFVALKLSD
jgi:sigma-B regulation protein RsbU (phosphoserine phosphatase)